MKKILLAAWLPWLCFAFLHAQTLPQKLQNLYAPLDKAQVPSGYLFDLAVPLADPLQYAGTLNDSNYVDMNVFGMLYGEMRSSKVNGSSNLPPSTIYKNKIRTLDNRSIPVVFMAWKYDRIHPSAFDWNLLEYTNGQIYDVAGRNQNPYWQDTTFLAAPLTSSVQTFTPTFILPEDLFFTNLNGELPAISIDPDDGLGWRVLSPHHSVQAQYNETGEKEIRFRLRYSFGAFLTHAHLTVTPAETIEIKERGGGGMFWPKELYESIPITASKSFTDPNGVSVTGSATMHIFYNNANCNGAKRMLRPLIVIEGFESTGITESSFDRMFNLLDLPALNNETQNLTDYLYPQEYDLIYVDFANGNDWIQRNAFVVEEVIKKVNELKNISGSVEENVIIGVSMGGIVGKYALLDMQANGPEHDTRLFITYDAPLQGANIPIGTQHLIKFMVDNISTYAGDDISIPGIDLAWAAIQAPVPQQLLKYHVNASTSDGQEPVNTVHIAFMAELTNMGELDMRHVALSNGAGDGTYSGNSFTGAPLVGIPGQLQPGEVIFSVSGEKVVCEEIGPIIACGDVNFNTVVRATGNNQNTTVFYGYIEKDTPNPFTLLSTEENINRVTKPFDTAPGGKSVLGILPLGKNNGTGLLDALELGGVTYSGDGLRVSHHSFIPTFSAVNALEPSSFSVPQTCGLTDRCISAVANPLIPEVNQFHIFLDQRIGDVLIDELVTNSNPPFVHPLEIANPLTTYFNIGQDIYSLIPTTTVSTTLGKLSINNTGKVGFATGNEPDSPKDLLYSFTKCGAIITIEQGASLVIGADDRSKHGILTVTSGSIVRIKSGGTLRVNSSQSALIVQNGATLIIEEGALVELSDLSQEDGGACIKIEPGGTLRIEGEFKLIGNGYFWLQGKYLNALEYQFPVYEDMRPDFSWQGEGKNVRRLFLDKFQLVTEGKPVLIKDIQMDCRGIGGIHAIGSDVRVINAQIEGVGSGNDVSGMGITTKSGSVVLVQNSDFVHLYRGFAVADMPSASIGFPYFNGCKFENCNIGLLAHNVRQVNVLLSEFNQCAGTAMALLGVSSFANIAGVSITGSGAEEIEHGGMLANIATSGSFLYIDPLEEAAEYFSTQNYGIYTENVTRFRMSAGTIENCSKGVFSPADSRSNFVFANQTVIQNNQVGVHVQHGFKDIVGNTEQYFGMVLLDCVGMLDNRIGILGTNVLLQIDAFSNSGTSNPVYVRANHFRRLSNGQNILSRLFHVCYEAGYIPNTIFARGNYWENLYNNSHDWRLLSGTEYCYASNIISPEISLNRTFPATLAPTGCPNQIIISGPGTPGPDPVPQDPDGCIAPPGNQLEVKLGTQFYYGYKTFSDEADSIGDFSGSDTLFQKIANLKDEDVSLLEEKCKKYVAASRAFVRADPSGKPDKPEDRNLLNSDINGILVQPNPASNEVIVKVTTSEVNTLYVWNAQGALMHELLNMNGPARLDISKWPNGIYLIDINGQNQRTHRKFVVQH